MQQYPFPASMFGLTVEDSTVKGRYVVLPESPGDQAGSSLDPVTTTSVSSGAIRILWKMPSLWHRPRLHVASTVSRLADNGTSSAPMIPTISAKSFGV